MKKEEDRKINVHDDAVVIAMGLNRCPVLTPRNENLWIKTNAERKALRKAKSYSKGGEGHFHTPPFKCIPVKGKLVINLKKNNYYEKSTFSIECWQHEIPIILSHYTIKRNQDYINVVSKYSFNGISYKVNTYPVW